MTKKTINRHLLYRPLLTLFVSLCLNGIPFYVAAQSDAIFDSLQTVIRTEVMNGTNSFYPAALAYDSLAALAGDTLKMGKGKNFLGMHYYYKGSHRQAIEYYLQALPFFTAIQDTYFIGMMNNNIGAAYEYRREPKHSIEYYQKALVSFTLLKE